LKTHIKIGIEIVSRYQAAAVGITEKLQLKGAVDRAVSRIADKRRAAD
jgi:hypothetical protein